MYLIIGIWGGKRRIYAAVKFFLFTMAGSLLMLLAILWLAWSYQSLAGAWSFAYRDLLALDLPLRQQLWLFAAFALAFAIKVPMFPLHTWLPDAHVEAPTGGSVDPRRHPAQARHLRLPALRPAALPARQPAGHAAPPRAGGGRHPLRRAGRLDADRHEEAGGLLVGGPPGLRDARPLRLRPPGLAGRAPADGQPRALDRRPLPARRHALRPPPHQGVRRLRRARQGDAVVRLLPGLLRPGLGRPAGAQRLRRRVPDPDRGVQDPGGGPALGDGRPAPSAWCSRRSTCSRCSSSRSGDRSSGTRTARSPISTGARSWRSLPLCVLMLWIGVAPRGFLEASKPALGATLASYQERARPGPRGAARPARRRS